jgi:hypothetical protein
MNSTTTAPAPAAPLTVEFVREKIATDDRWLLRGLVAIYHKQTEDEQRDAATKHTNGVGFTGVDATFASSLAEQVIRRGSLSPKQMIFARKIMKKYAAQLVRIAKEKEGKETP